MRAKSFIIYWLPFTDSNRDMLLQRHVKSLLLIIPYLTMY